MATTAAGKRLTEAHRRAQVRLSAETVTASRIVWGQLDPAHLDATSPAWLALQVGLLRSNRTRSAEISERYLTLFQLAELKERAPLPRIVVDFPTIEATTSMQVTGPIAVKRQMARTTSLADAFDAAFEIMVGAAMRIVLDGGREYIAESVAANDRVVGYLRVTDGAPCAFCAMLASRGAVYKRQSFRGSDARFAGGGGREKVHDHCGCQLEPVYRELQDQFAGKAGEWNTLWNDSTKGQGGKDAINAFRRAYEAQR